MKQEQSRLFAPGQTRPNIGPPRCNINNLVLDTVSSKNVGKKGGTPRFIARRISGIDTHIITQ
jgi:hypothetical protein